MRTNHNHPAGTRIRTRIAQASVGIGIGASLLAGAGAATAAPDHAGGTAAIAAHVAAAHPYSSVMVSPSVVRPGTSVTISGNAPKNARAGLWITLTSRAFVSNQNVNGVPAIRTQVLVNGKYSARAIIRSGLNAGGYSVIGTFEGQRLDTVASLTLSPSPSRPYSSVTASPGVVRPGTVVTISGFGPKNAPTGSWITLMSPGFVSNHAVSGIPAIRTQVLVNGKYSVTAMIRSGLNAGRYSVVGSFNGQGLDTVAWMTLSSSPGRPYSSVTVSPGVVRPSTVVTISGNGPKNARTGSWITLSSNAFASKQTVSGIPAIRTQVLVNGKYSAPATIRGGLKPGRYAVVGSFNGQGLDTVAWMTVR
jgi:3D (Asp-Asp-Asp) domain-containing protein